MHTVQVNFAIVLLCVVQSLIMSPTNWVLVLLMCGCVHSAIEDEMKKSALGATTSKRVASIIHKYIELKNFYHAVKLTILHVDQDMDTGNIIRDIVAGGRLVVSYNVLNSTASTTLYASSFPWRWQNYFLIFQQTNKKIPYNVLRLVHEHTYQTITFVVRLAPSQPQMTPEEAHEVLHDLYVANCLNVVLIDGDPRTNRVHSLSYDFYPRYRLRNITQDPHFEFYANLKDLQGYQMKVIQYDDFPQSFHHKRQVKGLDGYYLQTVLDYFNCTAQLKRVKIRDGEHLNTVVREMSRGAAELNINFNMFKMDENITGVYTLYIERSIILVPVQRIAPTSLHKIFKNGNMQAALTVILLILSVIWYLFSRQGSLAAPKTYATIYEYCMRGFLGTSIPIRQPKVVDCFFIVGIMFFEMIVMNAYYSQMVSDYTGSDFTESRMTTLAELNRSHLQIRSYHMTGGAKAYFERTYRLEFQQSMTRPWHLGQFNTSVGFLMPRKMAATFVDSPLNQDGEGHEYYYILREPVYITPASYRILRSAPYRNELNRLTVRLHEAGLEKNWRLHLNSDYKFYDDVSSETKEDSNSLTKGRYVLGLSDTITIFVNLLLGYVCSSIVFGIEVIYFKFGRELIRKCKRTPAKQRVLRRRADEQRKRHILLKERIRRNFKN